MADVTVEYYLEFGQYLCQQLQQRGLQLPPTLRPEFLGWYAHQLGWYRT